MATPGLYLTQTQATNTGGTGTVVTFPPAAPGGSSSQGSPYSAAFGTPPAAAAIFPAKNAVVVVNNPAGSGQSISAASLTFSDSVGGVTSTITYALTAVSIAAGANQTFYVALTSGLLATPKVSVTFAANPGAATLTALLALLPV